MIDPRCEAVFVARRGESTLNDRTDQVVRYRFEGSRIVVTMTTANGPRDYGFAAQKVAILRNPVQVPFERTDGIEVSGEVWSSPVTGVFEFGESGFAWRRVFYQTNDGEMSVMYPASDVRILRNAADRLRAPRSAAVLDYFRAVVAALDASDPTRKAFDQLRFVHPESVLARYLSGEPIGVKDSVAPGIVPFSSNLSQQDALEMALRHSISVIDGPPGTGKTQTILNLIANLVDTPGVTVGVASFSNPAVDNVRDKLEKEGYGFLAASLGNGEKRKGFFDTGRQHGRNAAVDTFVKTVDAVPPTVAQIGQLTGRLRQLRETERQLAQLRLDLDAYRLEQRHFLLSARREELPPLDDVPLLGRSSDRILDYLAETELLASRAGAMADLLRRMRGYFRYGSTRGIDPGDTDVVLRLQEAFYARRIEEIAREIAKAEHVLSSGGFADLVAAQRDLSVAYLRASLRQRYRATARTLYEVKTYRRPKWAKAFAEDYPVMLSTCHSLQSCLPEGRLLDYVIIDEASQVNLLAAVLALASCRNVIIVGDLRQLPQISDATAAAVAGGVPAAPYDYAMHSILSSVLELYGDALPRTMLREHYRSDPAIIGFCNKKFYDGQLIPFTPERTEGAVEQPLVVVRTPEGNHMRRHSMQGRLNQREAEVIASEVIKQYCAGLPKDRYGIVTPYRNQATTIQNMIASDVESDTAHGYQGREKDVMIMSTVLDETKDGHIGLRFADDPHLVNVGVSRAAKQLIVVTNNDLLPRSRNLRDLIGYIRYHNPENDVVDSVVISVFDLLYRAYSARLRPLAARLKGDMAFRSEDIVWTLLNDILDGEERYAGLRVTHQVLVRSLLGEDARLTAEQADFVRHRASVDFVVYNTITCRLVLAVEVDGFAFHANNPVQLRRDALKDEICRAYGIPLLRLPTTGSGEETRIRERLDAVLTSAESTPPFAVS